MQENVFSLKGLITDASPNVVLFRAVLIFAVLYGSYYFLLEGSKLHLFYLENMHSLCSWLLNLFGLEHEAIWNKYTQLGRLKTETWAEVGVDKRSDGILEISLLLAALLAWAVAWPRKLIFSVVGVVLLYVLVALRISMGLMVDHYMPLRYDTITTWVFPTLLFAFIMLYFIAYIQPSKDSAQD